MIGRDLIKAGPAPGDPLLLHERQAKGGRFQVGQLPLLVDGLVERGRLIGPGHAGEQTGALAVKIEARSELDDERKIGRDFGRRGRREKLAFDRLDGNLQTGHPPDFPRPGAGRVDHQRRWDPAGAGQDRLNPAAGRLHSGHLHPGQAADAQPGGRRNVSLNDRAVVGQSVVRAEQAAEGVLEIHHRKTAADLVAREPLRPQAEGQVHVHLPLEGGDVLFLVQNKEIADFAVIRRIPRFFLEPLEGRKAQGRHPAVDLGVEMGPDAAGALARRFGSEERLALEKDHVLRPALSQMIRRRRPDDAAAGDDDIGRFRKMHLVHLDLDFLSGLAIRAEEPPEESAVTGYYRRLERPAQVSI